MNHVSDNFLENAARSEVTTDDLNSIEIVNDISRMISEIIDVNNVLKSYEIATFNNLTSFTENITINVVTENRIMSHCDDVSYFTAAFSTLFSYEIKKHKNNHRTVS